MKPEEVWFWATHNGAEIDLVFQKRGKRWGLECKRADAPRVTSSMRIALDDLGLERILVIYPGSKSYSLAKKIQTIAFDTFLTELKSILKLKVV